jgi:hypothetical protein
MFRKYFDKRRRHKEYEKAFQKSCKMYNEIGEQVPEYKQPDRAPLQWPEFRATPFEGQMPRANYRVSE